MDIKNVVSKQNCIDYIEKMTIYGGRGGGGGGGGGHKV